MVQTMNGSFEAVGPAMGVSVPHYHPHYHLTTPTTRYYNGSTQDSMVSNAHITVVQIDQNQPTTAAGTNHSHHHHEQAGFDHQGAQSQEADFVTVLTIASTQAGPAMANPASSNCYYSSPGLQSSLSLSSSSQKVFVDNRRGEIEEEVTIYRLPGERLGMALRFDGGQGVCQTIRRVFVQNISANSPASKAIGLMLGVLREADEILQIDGRLSSSLTRLECITLLRDAPVCIRLFVRRSLANPCTSCTYGTPYVVPNCVDMSSTCCQMAPLPTSVQHELQTHRPNDYTSNHVTTTPTELALNHQMPSLDAPKKVPPPVPPRMATTTLSIKRKPRPTPVPPENEPHSSSVSHTQEVIGVSCGNVSSSSSSCESVIPIEKPPRRKNLVQNGNPPPLPPRRPKGPPPKPPTEHSPTSIMSVATSNTNNINSVPSLVTVISMSPNTTAESSSPPAIVNSISITRSSSTSTSVAQANSKANHIKTSATSKVTFTISNSKVSSFIRHTAEKLHRKLSGKTAAEEEHKSSQQQPQNIVANIEASSIKVNVASEHSSRVTLVTKPVTAAAIISSDPVVECNPEPTLTGRESSMSAFGVPPAAIYVDSCQDMDIGSVIESDTDDTSSSVSTIVERSNSILSESFMPCFEHSPYFSHKSRSIFSEAEFDSPLPSLSPHTISIVNRVLSPFERLERELDSENPNGPLSLSSFASNFVSHPEHSFRSLSLLPSQSTNETKRAEEQVQLSPNKTCTLIGTEQLAASNILKESEQLTGMSKSPISIPVDTDIRRDYENVQELPEKKPIETVELSYAQEDSALLEPPKEFANINTTEQRQNCASSLSEEQSPTNSDNSNAHNDMLESGTRHQSHRHINLTVDDEDEDEDFDVMKNDIISRVNDDKEDFMLDTNYLNESSSRYLFHHSGSELILAPYSELSSITEEDEEDELGSSNLDSKQQQQQTQLESNPVGDVQIALSTMHPTLDNTVQTTPDTIVESVKEDTQSIELDSLPIIDSNSEHYYELSNVDNKMKHFDESDNDEQRSNSSDSSLQKVSLDNVFDFLNETADEFEFVEKMLQLTNDKIDSIDDIMRIRESLRGLQQSEQRGNLQRFLDGKDVIDELMALSSSPHSTASSPENECQMSDVTENDLPLKLEHHETTTTTTTGTTTTTMGRKLPKPLSIDMTATNLDAGDEFTSLPVFLAIDNHRTRALPPLSMATDKCDHRLLSNGNLSKIPTLALNPAPPVSASALGKRSQSVSNIFNRAGGFNSLIELRPSLIPRPISNFNLSLPSEQETRLSQSHFSSRPPLHGHLYSHSGLNRSTSMQSIPSNSLPRYFVKNNKTPTRRTSSGSTSLWNATAGSGTNYHHNCLRNSDSNPPTYYGSLSRGVSKSTANVFNTGSLPRAPKTTVTNKVVQQQQQHSTLSSQSANGHNYGRTSSLIDLTYGFAPNKPSRPVQLNPVLPISSSRRHSSSNLFVHETNPSSDSIDYHLESQFQQSESVKSGDIEYRSEPIMEAPGQQGEDKQQQMPQKLLTTASTTVLQCEERFDSSSPEIPLLSSSTSSICSMSSTELTKACPLTRLSAKEHVVKNGDLVKPFFLPASAHREDSGIFASDDTSTSEFSQSPSPDFLIDTNNSTKIKQCTASNEQGEPHSVKDRIAFFDPVSSNNKTIIDLNRSLSCNKKMNLTNTLANGQVLSRSCSAPYETNCESGAKLSHQGGENVLLTPPQSPPNERINKEHNKLNEQPLLPASQFPTRRTETTAYPLTIEFKKPNPFSLRDSIMTARRHQNTCKLKGLVIPESANSNEEQVANNGPTVVPVMSQSCLLPSGRIDLPTIISEETIKVKHSMDFIEENGSLDGRVPESLMETSVRPIEIIDLKATPTSSVPKYSPMFKRRPFSLPVNQLSEINYQPKPAPVNNEELPPKTINQKSSTPPAVPPKPKMDQMKTDKMQKPVDIERSRLPPPPLPPKKKEIKLEILEETQEVPLVNNVEAPIVEAAPIITETVESAPIVEDVKMASEENSVEDGPNPVISDSSHTNEFVIHQKLYSMRAIVFELTEDEPAPLGIVLTGGLDSESKEVTVMHIAPDSLACRDGRLQIGDRIVSINGKLLLGLTHEETVELLQSSLSTQRVMIVFSRAHDQNSCTELPSPSSSSSMCSPSILASMNFANTPLLVSSVPATLPNGIEVNGGSGNVNNNSNNFKTIKAEITKDVNGLGFIIEGGKASSLGDRPIVIKRIYRGGPVDKEGSLMEGDELLSVNEQSVQGMTRAETWNFLKQLADGKVSLVARRKRYF